MLLSEGLHHLFWEYCQGAFQMFSTLFHNNQGLLLFCLCRALLVFHFRFAHGCDHAQIFCVHGLIHAHRKSRVIGVLMALCTSKPIIGKDAARVVDVVLGQDAHAQEEEDDAVAGGGQRLHRVLHRCETLLADVLERVVLRSHSKTYDADNS